MTLLARLQDPGFTPRLDEVDALVDLLADEKVSKAAGRAIGRVGPAAFVPLLARLEGSRAPLRAHIVRAMGRFVGDPRAVEALLAALGDGDPKARRNAAIELGHAPPDGAIEDALLVAWDRDPRPEMRRTIAASLGKVGTARGLPLLREATRSSDPELARIAKRACAMVERTASRDERGRVDGARSGKAPVDVVAAARRGLEDLLAEELAQVAAVSQVRVVGPGAVRVRLVGAMADLFAGGGAAPRCCRFSSRCRPRSCAKASASPRPSRASRPARRPARSSERGPRGPSVTGSPGPTAPTAGRPRGESASAVWDGAHPVS